jgi:hypothetical protein
MPLPAPRTFRDTLRLLRHHQNSRDLDHLLQRVDWSGVSPRQIYHAFLGRPPERAQFAIPGPNWTPQAHARLIMELEEFRTSLLSRIADSLPGRQRLLFVHIPKCAGTDLEITLGQRHPKLMSWDIEPNRLNAEQLAARVAEFMSHPGETIFIGGHLRLKWFLDQQLYRFRDRIFTVVRHPRDIALSYANYVVRRFADNPKLTDSDTSTWAKPLGLERFDRDMTAEERAALALRVLRNPAIVPSNVICTYLGDGDFASAIEMMARVDIEISATSRYDAWIGEAWGIKPHEKLNASPRILTWDQLDPADRDRIERTTAEDVRLYERVMERLERAGRNSVTGPELV